MGKTVKTDNKRAKKAVKYLVTAFVFLLAFYAIPYVYTSNAQSCTSCHSMKPYYDSWKKSSHATAANNCFHCHVKQGALNLFIYRVSFYREIYASMVGADLKPFGATIPGSSCCSRRGCHSLNRMSSQSGDIKINHRTHVTKGHVACVRCHPGVAHPGVGKTGTILPTAKICKECHAAQINSCSFCHIKREPRSFGH